MPSSRSVALGLELHMQMLRHPQLKPAEICLPQDALFRRMPQLTHGQAPPAPLPPSGKAFFEQEVPADMGPSRGYFHEKTS